jgi:hypothetical protein
MSLKIKNLASLFWTMLGAFGLYFCAYAFRKPFLSGTYEGLTCLGFSYKTILILVQVLGYMTSKIIGIKVISEIKHSHRILLILILLGIGQLALYLFAIVNPPYNILCLFFNGLPLGMIYGLIFSFLEGRKLTEMLGIALSINLVMTSGILKSVYLFTKTTFGITEMWLPFVIAFVCNPLIIGFAWMLHKTPQPSKEDIELRLERTPMTKKDRKVILKKYGFGLICMAVLYTFFTGLRDFRDNFSIEIWKEMNNMTLPISLFAKYETSIATVVMFLLGLLVMIKSNKTAYRTNNLLIFCSLMVLLSYNLQFDASNISYETWYIFTGIALFLPYLLIQVAFFERLIALLQIKGNVGFLIYICDSSGYLLSVLIMFCKELFFKNNLVSYSKLLINCSIVFSIIGMVLIAFQFVFFENKLSK